MLNKYRQLEEKNEPPSFQDRVLMAVLAPIAFNISIIIVLAVIFHRSVFIGRFLFYQTHWSVSFTFLVSCLLPAIGGFILGTRKFATLLGHFFYTNMEHEKDMVVTIVCWVALLSLADLLYGAA